MMFMHENGTFDKEFEKLILSNKVLGGKGVVTLNLDVCQELKIKIIGAMQC